VKLPATATWAQSYIMPDMRSSEQHKVAACNNKQRQAVASKQCQVASSGEQGRAVASNSQQHAAERNGM
jgi:hypothetical protein